MVRFTPPREIQRAKRVGWVERSDTHGTCLLAVEMVDQLTLLEAVHHVVHDYANLVSSGKMAVHGSHLGKALAPPINTHVGHAFLVNCRKMYYFFMCLPKNRRPDDIWAADFLTKAITFDLANWGSWHVAMHKQLMHVTLARVETPKAWKGHDENKLFLNEFMNAWKEFRGILKEPYKSRFDTEIGKKLDSDESEYRGLDLW